jgi:hypothetical protein
MTSFQVEQKYHLAETNFCPQTKKPGLLYRIPLYAPYKLPNCQTNLKYGVIVTAKHEGLYGVSKGYIK